MMKKNFLRMKQLADQTFLGAGKTKELDDKELEIADERVESLKKALVDIHKRITYNNSSNANPSDSVEKRMRKYPEYQLALTLNEHASPSSTPTTDLFAFVAHVASGAEQEVAKARADHDRQVEELVVVPVQEVLEREVPNIAKSKGKLARYVLDKDATRNRFNKNGASSETIKEDMEGAEQKVEQTRDSLAVDMFSLLRRENELAQFLLQLLKLQKSFYYSALNSLEQVIPELEREIGNSKTKPVFGVELEEHLRVRDLQLAYPLQLCITALSDRDRIAEEGLFRISGSSLKVKRLKLSIDSGCFQTLLSEYDNPVLASTLKCYLRELPDPLLTYSLHDDWLRVANLSENDRYKDVQRLLSRLPSANRTNLAYLIQFLSRVLHCTDNKMTASNIAIVIAPNLLWSRNAESNANMHDAALVNVLVEFLVKNAEVLFPDDLSHLILPEIHRCLPMSTQHSSASASMSSSRNHMDTMTSDLSSLVEGSTTALTTNPSTAHFADSPKPHNRNRKQKLAPTPPNVIEQTTNAHYNRKMADKHDQKEFKSSADNLMATSATYNADLNMKTSATYNSTSNSDLRKTSASFISDAKNNTSELMKTSVDMKLSKSVNYNTDLIGIGTNINNNTNADNDIVILDELLKNEDMDEVNSRSDEEIVDLTEEKTGSDKMADRHHGDKHMPVAAPRVSLLDGFVKDSSCSSSEHLDSAATHLSNPNLPLETSTLGRRPSSSSARNYDQHRGSLTDADQPPHPAVVQLRAGAAASGSKPVIPMRPASLKPTPRPGGVVGGSTPSPTAATTLLTQLPPAVGGASSSSSVAAVGAAAAGAAALAAAAARSAGHDSQLSEKERFLSSQDNNSSSQNSSNNNSCPASSRSVGKLAVNGHLRTRSDGGGGVWSQGVEGGGPTPPLPRPPPSKPSQPPPPPPTTITSTSTQPKTDSTDL